jgi:hypothetical protein
MNELTTKLAEVVTQLQSGIAAHGGDAIDAGLTAIRVSGGGFLLLGFMFSIFGCLLLLLAYKMRNIDSKDTEFGPSCGLVLCSLPIFLMSLLMLFYVWNWVAVFAPKVWLANHIIESVGAR